MVAVFIPGLKSTLGAASPDHQSQADFPALIHDVSAIFDGGFRFSTMFDSIRRPGASPIINTRQGVVTGAWSSTAMPGWSSRGESSAHRPNAGLSLRRYMPA